MIHVRITGRGSYLLQSAIAKHLRESLGLQVSEEYDCKPSEVAPTARRIRRQSPYVEVLITVREDKP